MHLKNDTVIHKSYICGPASPQTEPNAFHYQISVAVTQLKTYNKVCNMLHVFFNTTDHGLVNTICPPKRLYNSTHCAEGKCPRYAHTLHTLYNLIEIL